MTVVNEGKNGARCEQWCKNHQYCLGYVAGPHHGIAYSLSPGAFTTSGVIKGGLHSQCYKQDVPGGSGKLPYQWKNDEVHQAQRRAVGTYM